MFHGINLKRQKELYFIVLQDIFLISKILANQRHSQKCSVQRFARLRKDTALRVQLYNF